MLSKIRTWEAELRTFSVAKVSSKRLSLKFDLEDEQILSILKLSPVGWTNATGSSLLSHLCHSLDTVNKLTLEAVTVKMGGVCCALKAFIAKMRGVRYVCWFPQCSPMLPQPIVFMKYGNLNRTLLHPLKLFKAYLLPSCKLSKILDPTSCVCERRCTRLVKKNLEVWKKHIDLMPKVLVSCERQQFSWARGLQKKAFLLLQVVSKSGCSHALPREPCGCKRTSGHSCCCLVRKQVAAAAKP